ncbi:MAG: metallophosphoesterase family protein [Fimbriiglobus sp.]
MRIGVLSDSHDEIERTQRAVERLRQAGAEALIHCGDLTGPPIVEAICELPSWFVFGNHDCDSVPALRKAAEVCSVGCLEWGGVLELAGCKVGVVHGHMTTDLRRVLAQKPQFLLSGHSHLAGSSMVDGVLRINPGALHRADCYTVALLDLPSGHTEWLEVD